MSDCRREVREAIRSQTTPFCIVDLISRLEQEGFADKGIILDELDKLYDEGLVEYDCVTTFPDEEIYAFFIKK